MNADRIRQELERELGERYKTYAPRRDRLLVHCPDGTLLIAADLNEYAAIGRALQSAAGEPMIPLREAVRVVEEADRVPGWWGYGELIRKKPAIAALQALGGGDET